MLDSIVPTLTVFSSFLVLVAAFVGIGLSFEHSFGARSATAHTFFLAFWTGFGLAILFLMLWNFFFPVNAYALAVVLSAGIIGFILRRRNIFGVIANTRSLLSWKLIAGAVGSGLWIANLSTGPFNSWDGGLYHLQAVQWASTYPIVPGLANLHGPLAFNNSSFLYAAMLDSGPWAGRAFHVTNGLFVVVMVWQAMMGGAYLARPIRTGDSRHVYDLMLLAPALYFAMWGRVSDFNTDLPTALLLLFSGSAMYRYLAAFPSNTAERAYSVVALAVAFATVVCLKMSTGIYSAVAILVVLAVWWKQRPALDRLAVRTLAWVGGTVSLFAVTWMARGVVMSGYPLFPVPVFGFPVEWRAPIEHAAAEAAYIGFTEREFGWHIGWGWIRTILLRDIFSVFVPLLVTGAYALFLVVFARVKAAELFRAPAGMPVWMLVPVAISIVFWLTIAPSSRYGAPFFWTLAALTVALGHTALARRNGGKSARKFLWCCVFVGLLPPLIMPIKDRLFPGLSDAMSGAVLILPPGPDHGFHPIGYVPKYRNFRTDSGLVLHVPDKTGQAKVAVKCWNTPLPCTPNPAANLSLLSPGDIGRGFKVNGEWQMQDWPIYFNTRFLPEWRQRQGSAKSR